MGCGDRERSRRVVAAPTGAFQVDFGPGVEVAVLLQRGVAFVAADEAGRETERADREGIARLCAAFYWEQ